MFRAEIKVMPKKTVLDPQGKAILHALHSLEYGTVTDAKAGKLFNVFINEKDEEAANIMVKNMCEKLLCNQVIEDFEYSVAKVPV